MHCNAVARGESVSTIVYSSQTTFFSRPVPLLRASACMHLVSAWINNRTASQRKAIVQRVYISSPRYASFRHPQGGRLGFLKLRFLVAHAFRFPVFGISRRPFQLRCDSVYGLQDKKHTQRAAGKYKCENG